MAELKNWPYPLNQAGYKWPAQIVRAQHYSATSGGNGVSSPGAMKVTAQPAPDGSIQILPGGADVVSTYPEAPEQTYYSHIFQPLTITVPPTGSSSGGRTDLVIRRVLDPEFETHPEHSGPMTETAAKLLDFEWNEVIPGADENTNLTYPHVKLAKIVRPPNTTIVQPDHIVDLRVLSKPEKDIHVHALNMPAGHEEAITSSTVVWPQASSHYVNIPVFATGAKILASWDQVRAHAEAGDSGPAHGNARLMLARGEDRLQTQQTHWNTTGEQNFERFSIALSDTIPIPERFRGKPAQVQFRASKYPGPNAYADSNSSTSLIIFFEQGVE